MQRGVAHGMAVQNSTAGPGPGVTPPGGLPISNRMTVALAASFLPMSLPLRCARAGRRLLGAVLLAVAGSCLAVQPGTDLSARLDAARVQAGVDPNRTLAALAAVRAEAQALGRLDWQLDADEIACRVQSDLDPGEALRVADAGLASAGSTPPAAARAHWLRLRACRAGLLFDGAGDRAAGDREIDAVLRLATDEGLASALSMAQLERGVHRSRQGDLDRGQADLMAACDSLRQHGRPGEHALCLGHLANHYRRAGDLDEALRLTIRLRDAARASGAVYDESIHVYAIALVHDEQADWPAALAAYRQAAATFARMHDQSGLSYAEHGMATALWRMDQRADALVQVESAMRRLPPGDDPKHHARMTQLHAELLLASGRPAEAQAALATVEATVRSAGDGPPLASWLVARAGAMQALGHWREAYQLLDEARRIEARLHKQRLSEQSARLRMQFNRARDAEDLSALRQLNAQGQRLRQTQAVALVLFVLLLAASSVFGWRKLRQARHLQTVAMSDELTGLPNRRALLAHAEDSLVRARRTGDPVAVLMVDVDHFKRINDGHGHAVGDAVLRHLAQVLPAGLRGQDRLGRLGGEEFLAVLPGTSLAQARQVAERMRSSVAATPLGQPAGALAFTVSIGVAVSGAAAEPFDSLLQRADAALYRAKDGGRNAVVADEALHQASAPGRCTRH